jgi:hypothetical protein
VALRGAVTAQPVPAAIQLDEGAVVTAADFLTTVAGGLEGYRVRPPEFKPYHLIRF